MTVGGKPVEAWQGNTKSRRFWKNLNIAISYLLRTNGRAVQYNVTTRLVASGLIDRLPGSRVYLSVVIARLGEQCLHVLPSHQIVD